MSEVNAEVLAICLIICAATYDTLPSGTYYSCGHVNVQGAGEPPAQCSVPPVLELPPPETTAPSTEDTEDETTKETEETESTTSQTSGGTTTSESVEDSSSGLTVLGFEIYIVASAGGGLILLIVIVVVVIVIIVKRRNRYDSDDIWENDVRGSLSLEYSFLLAGWWIRQANSGDVTARHPEKLHATISGGLRLLKFIVRISQHDLLDNILDCQSPVCFFSQYWKQNPKLCSCKSKSRAFLRRSR